MDSFVTVSGFVAGIAGGSASCCLIFAVIYKFIATNYGTYKGHEDYLLLYKKIVEHQREIMDLKADLQKIVDSTNIRTKINNFDYKLGD